LAHCYGVVLSLLWHCFVIDIFLGYVIFLPVLKGFVVPVGTELSLKEKITAIIVPIGTEF